MKHIPYTDGRKILENDELYDDSCGDNDNYNINDLIESGYQEDDKGLLSTETTVTTYCLSESEYNNKINNKEHKYNYQITNKDDCPKEYAYWDGNKCYERYKKINAEGEPIETTGKDKCEKGYGKWFEDDKACVKLNMNKSDCGLSGGFWRDTIPDSADQPEGDDGDDDDDYLIYNSISFGLYLVVIFLIGSSFKEKNDKLILMVHCFILFVSTGYVYVNKKSLKKDNEEEDESIFTYKNALLVWIGLGVCIVIYFYAKNYSSDTYKGKFNEISDPGRRISAEASTVATTKGKKKPSMNNKPKPKQPGEFLGHSSARDYRGMPASGN